MNIILLNRKADNAANGAAFEYMPGADFYLPKRDERAIHLIKTLRKTVGGSFEAGVFGGKRGTGIIEEVLAADIKDGGGRVVAEAGALRCSFAPREDPPPRVPVTIAAGFPRPIQTRRLLRDLSSMGIAEIMLFGGDLGEKSYRDTTLLEDGGARAALIEGAIQGRDTRIPRLRLFPSLDSLLQAGIPQGWVSHPELSSIENGLPNDRANNAGHAVIRVAADNTAEAEPVCGGRLFFDGWNAPRTVEIVIVIGSERGFSARERALLAASGFASRSLGSRPMRTEAAATAFAALAIANLR